MNAGQATVTGPQAVIDALTGAGSLTVGDGTHSTVLQIAGNSGAGNQSGITIKANSTLDLNNNHLFIPYGANPDPIASIAAYLKSGFNGGAWNGTGIDSSAAANNNANPLDPRYGLGFADSADAGNPARLPTDQIEIEYTLLGDANLDGVVSGDDFTILTDNLGKQVNGWDKGDFNYDGVVSGDDFTLLTDNLGKQANGADVAIPAADYAAINAFAAANGLMADVPEPATLSLLTLGTLGTLLQRRCAPKS